MRRYVRQVELVDQDVLADAEVAVHGTGPAVPYLLQCLVMLGVATGRGRVLLVGMDRPVRIGDVAGQSLLRPEDIGSAFGSALAVRAGGIDPAINIEVGDAPAPGAVHVAAPAAGERPEVPAGACWGQVLATAVRVGTAPGPEGGPTNLFTPALACVAGGVLAQSVLARLGAMRRGQIDGMALTWSPFVTDDFVLPTRIPPSRLVLCGAGALGNWAAAVLAGTAFEALDLCVVDMDGAIEEHNLNRHLLYDRSDVGRPKAERAVERLAAINPNLQLNAVPTAVDVFIRDRVFADEVLRSDDPAIHAQWRRTGALADALRSADAILSCPDNHRTRWVLNDIAERRGVPWINGATDGFAGRVHVCDPRDHGRCLVCWLGGSVARCPDRLSCGGAAAQPVPVAAIVTSTAVIGGIQAAAVVAELAGKARAVARHHAWDGQAGTLVGHRAADRDPAECPHHLFAAAGEWVSRADR